MPYTDPATLTWAFQEVPASAKLNTATNDQFLALFPDDAAGASWTPTLFAEGGGASVSAVVGRRYRIGALEFLWVRWTISAVGSGEYYVEVPTAASGVESGTVLGSAFASDTAGSSTNNAVGVVLRFTGTPQRFKFAFNGGNATSVFPFTFGSGDFLGFHAVYPVA